MAGDQQAAAIGQACLAPGDTKATYGTGAFVLTNTGAEAPPQRHRLLSTIAWQLGGERSYALEGSVFVAGSLIKWLRDDLGLLASAAESEALARSVARQRRRPDRAALVGPRRAALAARRAGGDLRPQLRHRPRPYRPRRARGDGPPDPRSDDRLRRRRRAVGELRIDGGMAANDWLAQDLADMLGLAVERPAFVETTALGAAMLAGVGCGLFGSLAEAAAMRGEVRRFEPGMDADARRAPRRLAAGAAVGARRRDVTGFGQYWVSQTISVCYRRLTAKGWG